MLLVIALLTFAIHLHLHLFTTCTPYSSTPITQDYMCCEHQDKRSNKFLCTTHLLWVFSSQCSLMTYFPLYLFFLMAGYGSRCMKCDPFAFHSISSTVNANLLVLAPLGHLLHPGALDITFHHPALQWRLWSWPISDSLLSVRVLMNHSSHMI